MVCSKVYDVIYRVKEKEKTIISNMKKMKRKMQNDNQSKVFINIKIPV